MRPDQRLRAETAERRVLRLVEPVRPLEPVVAGGAIDDTRELAPLIPVPGRHASRRRWLPLTLQGPAGLEPWHVGVVAAVLLVALGATCWWLLHRTPTLAPESGTPAPVAASQLVPMSAGASPGAGASAATSVTIDVAGKVRRPGVRTLPIGSRVIDALQAAGGVKRGVDLSGLNQARVLTDGEQILVGETASVSAPAGSGVAGSAAGAGAMINLNTATAADLDTLPGVGPVTAQSILDYRTQHGGFGSVQELLDVDGIGEATLAKLEPHVTV